MITGKLILLNQICFCIPRVYSRDELLPLLQNCVVVLGNALDSPETGRLVHLVFKLCFG